MVATRVIRMMNLKFAEPCSGGIVRSPGGRRPEVGVGLSPPVNPKSSWTLRASGHPPATTSTSRDWRRPSRRARGKRGRSSNSREGRLPGVDVYELMARELGAGRVLRDEAALDVYATDESRLGRFPPDAAVLARSREEIEIVLRLAAEHRIPVTPRGAGSGMTGGALAVRGGLVLSTEAMTAIKHIDLDDRIAIVEPGVINGDLQAGRRSAGTLLSARSGQPGVLLAGRQRRRERGGPARLQVRGDARLDAGHDGHADGRRDAEAGAQDAEGRDRL